jgi:hypothetical protein
MFASFYTNLNRWPSVHGPSARPYHVLESQGSLQRKGQRSRAAASATIFSSTKPDIESTAAWIPKAE